MESRESGSVRLPAIATSNIDTGSMRQDDNIIKQLSVYKIRKKQAANDAQLIM